MIPEILSEKTVLKAMLDNLPNLVEKFSAIEGQVRKVVANVNKLIYKVKTNPSLLLKRHEKRDGGEWPFLYGCSDYQASSMPICSARNDVQHTFRSAG